MESKYVGKIKNTSAQVVKAPIQTLLGKKGKVKQGSDLRAGTGKK